MSENEKRDAWVKVVFFLSKKTAFTQASLFIFGRWMDITVLPLLFLLCLRITTCPPEFQTFWRHYSSILARCFCRESVTKLPLEAVQNQKFGGKNVFHTVRRYMEIQKVEFNPSSDRKQGELKANWVKRGQMKSKVA